MNRRISAVAEVALAGSLELIAQEQDIVHRALHRGHFGIAKFVLGGLAGGITSKASRSSYSSATSLREKSTTTLPPFGACRRKPSAVSRRTASRSGPRLLPNSRAIGSFGKRLRPAGVRRTGSAPKVQDRLFPEWIGVRSLFSCSTC